MSIEVVEYGSGNTSYKAAGELSGLTTLVDMFFDMMDSIPEAKIVRDMYPTDLTPSRKKLAYFLSGWLGGPRIYQESFGEISIPAAHRHLNIDEEASAAWILCMEKALAQQTYDETFKKYLITQLRVPAERIVTACRR